MKNKLIDKIEKDEIRLIRKGEIVAVISIIIVIISAITQFVTNINLRSIIYIGALLCTIAGGFTLYLRFALGNWKF
nr:hypothetical protein XXXJIFNMEKO1_EEONHAKH_00023 [Culicoides impunctatus]